MNNSSAEKDRLRTILSLIESEDISKLKELVLTSNDLAVQDCECPLYDAVGTGNINLVELLLSQGADPNAFWDLPPLEEALSLGDINLISLLLKYGANPNITDTEDDMILETSVAFGDLEIIKTLVEHGAVYGDIIEDCLSSTEEYGHEDIYDYLQKLKSNTDITSEKPDFQQIQRRILHGEVGHNILRVLGFVTFTFSSDRKIDWDIEVSYAKELETNHPHFTNDVHTLKRNGSISNKDSFNGKLGDLTWEILIDGANSSSPFALTMRGFNLTVQWQAIKTNHVYRLQRKVAKQ